MLLLWLMTLLLLVLLFLMSSGDNVPSLKEMELAKGEVKGQPRGRSMGWMLLGNTLSTIPILPYGGARALFVDPFLTNEVVLEGQMRKLDSVGVPLLGTCTNTFRIRFWGHLLFLPICRFTPGETGKGLETSLVLTGLIRISVVDSGGVIGLM